MQPGAITGHIDVAQIAFWAFFLAFLGIVYYLRREDKREGYPLRDPGHKPREGFPLEPEPLPLIRQDGSLTAMPHHDPDPPIAARPLFLFPGAPFTPLGNKLTSNLGPSAYAMRRDEPFLTVDGKPQVQPLRIATDWSVMPGDADPRGMQVLDVRFRPVGTVRDIWVDRGVKILRYLEVELDPGQGAGRVLLPIYFCHVDERERSVRVTALRTGQFADVPRTRSPDIVTGREEDQITSYYAGGHFHLDSYSEGT